MTVAGNVLIAKSGDSENQGSSFGMYNGIISIGLVLGSTLGGVMSNRFGLSYSFFTSALLLLASFFLSFLIKEPEDRKSEI